MFLCMGMYVERFKQQHPDAGRIVAGIYVTGVIDSSLLNDLPAGAYICGEWARYRMQS